MSYDEVLRRLEIEDHESVRLPSGKELLGETEVFWDAGSDSPRRHLRVMVDLSDPARSR
jgi:hypothetical protein